MVRPRKEGVTDRRITNITLIHWRLRREIKSLPKSVAVFRIAECGFRPGDMITRHGPNAQLTRLAADHFTWRREASAGKLSGKISRQGLFTWINNWTDLPLPVQLC